MCTLLSIKSCFNLDLWTLILCYYGLGPSPSLKYILNRLLTGDRRFYRLFYINKSFGAAVGVPWDLPWDIVNTTLLVCQSSHEWCWLIFMSSPVLDVRVVLEELHGHHRVVLPYRCMSMQNEPHMVIELVQLITLSGMKIYMTGIFQCCSWKVSILRAT